MTFPTHSTDSSNWNNASNGLFGDKTGKLKELYDSSIRDLDEYIFGEFVFDQSGETPSFNPDTIYQTLMKSPYINKKYDIFDYRNELIGRIWRTVVNG